MVRMVLMNGTEWYRMVLMGDLINFFHNHLPGQYKETKYFREVIKAIVLDICESYNTNETPYVIHDFLKFNIFGKPEYRKGVYITIKYKVLPILWKNHKSIERKKQRRLSFLANELDNTAQHVKAHIIRTIVKPYIRDMNLKWGKMTSVQKLEKVDWNIP